MGGTANVVEAGHTLALKRRSGWPASGAGRAQAGRARSGSLACAAALAVGSAIGMTALPASGATIRHGQQAGPVSDSYEDFVVISATGTGSNFVPETPGLGTTFTGQAEARWGLEFGIDFTLDRSAGTVDAEPWGASSDGQAGVALSVYSSPSTDTFSLTARGSTGSVTCSIPPNTRFQPSGTLSDGWGYGSSTSSYRSGVMEMDLAGNVSDAFHCSNKGGFSIGPYTVPGLSPGGQGGANCSNPPSSLPIPVSWIGVYRSEASLSRTYTCVPTYLNAEFTARVRYTIEVEVSGAQLLEYVKACEAAGIDVDDALAFIATRVPAAERRAELASRVRAAQHELDLVPDEAIPPAAAQEVKKAVTDLKKEEGWMTVEEDKTFSPGSYAPDLDGCASALRAAEAAIDSSTGK